MRNVFKSMPCLLLLCLMLFSQLTFAVTTEDVLKSSLGNNPSNTKSTTETNSEKIGVVGSDTFSEALSKAIKKVVLSIESFSQEYRGKITPMAITLLTALSVIALSWAGMQLAMTSGSLSEPMNRLITVIFTIGFATWLVNSGYDTFAVQGIDNLMNELVSKVNNGGTIDQMFHSFMISEFQIIGGVIDKLAELTIWELITTGGFSILLLAAMFLAMLVTSVIGMIAVLTSLIMVAIAIAVGPIFIPFIVLGKTSFLFDGWVKFLINACLTKVIVAILLGIGMAAMSAAANPQGAGTLEIGSMIGSLLSALAVSGVVAQLMIAAPGIASAVTSGGAIGMDGFAGRMHSTSKTMGRNASVGLSQGAGNKLANAGNKVGGDAGKAMQNVGNRLRSSSTSGNISGQKPTQSSPHPPPPPPPPPAAGGVR